MTLRIMEMARSALHNGLMALCLLTLFRMALVESSRADLGNYLSMKEYPTQEEKITVDTVTYAAINYTYRTFDIVEVRYHEEKARYGEGRTMNVTGYLVHVADMLDPTDHRGCSPKIVPPNRYHIGEHSVQWVALIKRGGCTFDDKIRNAYWHRAVGVIIYNDEDSMTLEKMKVIDKDRNITAVFTYKSIGEEMAQIVDRGTQVWVSITQGPRIVKPVTNLNKTSVLFVSVSFIVLMIISLVWLIFYYVQRFRYLQSKDQHSRQLCTVAKRIIGKIPTKSGKNDDKDSENDCCAVCIEPYKATDCIRVLPCRHEFHKNCIDPWLLEHRTCPMCKLDVLKYYGFVVIGSEESFIQLDLDVEAHGHNPQEVRDQILSTTNRSDSNQPIQITITPAGFDNTPVSSDFPFASRIIRRGSCDTMAITRRVATPVRSSSSMSHCPTNESFANHLFFFQSTATTGKTTSKLSARSTTDHNVMSLHMSKKENKSLSLPGTLKIVKPNPTTQGSNNCYAKSANSDLKHLAIRLEKGNLVAGNRCLRKGSDNELLLTRTELSNCDSQTLLHPPSADCEPIVLDVEPKEASNAHEDDVPEKQTSQQ